VNYRVVFDKEARADLFNLYYFIADRSSSDRAAAYISRLRKFCLGLQTFPQRGYSMDHIRAGLRIVGFERRATIAFEITTEEVVIFRIAYGGRDIAGLLSSDK
jgi:toxin ParE1/3/4